jgi:hypothetical protein
MAGESACPTLLHKHLRRLWGRRFRLPLIFSHSLTRAAQKAFQSRDRKGAVAHSLSGLQKINGSGAGRAMSLVTNL